MLTMLPLSTCLILWSSYPEHMPKSLMDVKLITWLYDSTEYDLPITKDPFLNQSSNQVGIHIWTNLPTKWDYIFLHDLKSPYMNEYNNYYIIGLYMTFTSNDMNDIYNKYQIHKQDHDSYQKLSYTIYDLHHKHMSATLRTITCICPSSDCKIRQCCFNIINMWLSMWHIDINSSSWIYQYQLALFL